MQIIPTTNPQTNFLEVEKRLEKIKDLSAWIQIDVTDGILVKPPTFPLELLKKPPINLDKNIFDVHLMVKNPINWINKCLFIEATRIVGQVEMMDDREKFITTIKDHGCEAGLSFDVDTKIDNIPEETDLILIMGRKMGFNPFNLDDKIFEKIKIAKSFGKKVALDGGASIENIDKLIDSGLDIIYSYQNYFDLINYGKDE
jgi:ribulose-phosphate 3-epimerase